MPIHLRQNQYNGVNPHLHSHLQRRGGGWEMFHDAHITHLTESIDQLLPDGYFVLNEKSLQLSALDFETGEQKLSRTRPDINIIGEPTLFRVNPTLTGSAPTATLPLVRITVEDEPLTGIAIYRLADQRDATPITRIELLSPANKPPGTHYRQYLRKRNQTLDAGTNLVELDYLHETALPIDLIPSYPNHEDGAFPYMILVSEPRPLQDKPHTLVYGFQVDDPIPTVSVPLAEGDSITVDFGAVYHRTFASNRYYGLKIVDYEQLPARFETYSKGDQERIRARMSVLAKSPQPKNAG